MRAALVSYAVLVLVSACAQAPVDSPRHVRNRFFVREDAAVTKVEPPPHDGTGQSTAYRYFDDVTDARVVFRKRALHKGASIGMHVLKHDEVYYVVSGQGELRVDDRRVDIGPDTAIFMHEGADVGIWQKGDEDLVVIIAYPPAEQGGD
jgi:mannose-6-phosphate isomerase-like protein (cupin superfamily)